MREIDRIFETMEIDHDTGLPMSLAPITPDTQEKNEFQPSRIFPFQTWQSLPSFSTALLDISVSAGTLVVSAGCLAASVFVVLPISLVKTAREGIRSVLGKSKHDAASEDSKRRCIVINGAR